jgi:hypothetical protein
MLVAQCSPSSCGVVGFTQVNGLLLHSVVRNGIAKIDNQPWPSLYVMQLSSTSGMDRTWCTNDRWVTYNTALGGSLWPL